MGHHMTSGKLRVAVSVIYVIAFTSSCNICYQGFACCLLSIDSSELCCYVTLYFYSAKIRNLVQRHITLNNYIVIQLQVL